LQQRLRDVKADEARRARYQYRLIQHSLSN